MKSIILTSLLSAIFFIAMTLFLRFYMGNLKVKGLLIIYSIFFIILIYLNFITSDDLGFLSSNYISGNFYFDLVFSLFIFTAVFFGGFLQLYNLVDRGLSLRMLIDIKDSSSPRGLSAKEMVTSYSAGQGICWMYQKRISGMACSGLIIEKDKKLILTKKGNHIAHLFKWMRLKIYLEIEESK